MSGEDDIIGCYVYFLMNMTAAKTLTLIRYLNGVIKNMVRLKVFSKEITLYIEYIKSNILYTYADFFALSKTLCLI